MYPTSGRIALEGGLGVVAGVAGLDGTHTFHTVAEKAAHENTPADAALVDVFVASRV